MEMITSIIVDPSALPDPTLTEVDFRETTFFHSRSESLNTQLPQPSLVRQRLAEKNSPNDVIVYRDLGLAVKCGNRVRVEEALTLRMMNLLLPKEVPTPEVFGWRVFEGDVYIYMELMSGSTLNNSFEFLSQSEKAVITEQLSQIVVNLRRLRQVTGKPLLGISNY